MDWMWDMRETEFEDDSVDLKDRTAIKPRQKAHGYSRFGDIGVKL